MLEAITEVYKRKIISLYRKIKTTLFDPIIGEVSQMYSCINNLNIRRNARFVPNSSCQAEFIKLQKIAKNCLKKRKRY